MLSVPKENPVIALLTIVAPVSVVAIPVEVTSPVKLPVNEADVPEALPVNAPTKAAGVFVFNFRLSAGRFQFQLSKNLFLLQRLPLHPVQRPTHNPILYSFFLII